MESEKILNPRFLSIYSSSNKAMPNEPQKAPSSPSLLDRFRVLLNQRYEELGASGEEMAVLPPSTEEIVQLYKLVLAELTFNSKPIITDLTIIAGEQREHGDGIADAICTRILEVPVEQKLPSLYLLDSIVKNIGRDYIRHFSSRLPEVFFEAYKQANPNLHPAMRHLFGTWSTVFPTSVLHKIEIQLQFSSSANQQSSLRASESPQPTRGIHVNPKYLHRSEPSSTESNMRGISSSVRVYGQNPHIGYDDADLDHSEGTSPMTGPPRVRTAGSFGRSTSAIGGNKLLPSSSSSVVRPLSASNRPLSSELDEFEAVSSPRRFSDGASPSAIDYRLGRAISKDNESTEWRGKYNLSNGNDHQRPRALIDAYGIDTSKQISYNKPFQMERIDVNGMHNRVTAKSWQNAEEEEFDWEDMSPTLDRGRTNELLPSSVPLRGGVRARPGLGIIRDSQLESDIQNNLLGQPQLQETRNFSQSFSQPPHLFNARGRGKDLQVTISAVGLSSSGGETNVQFARAPSMASRMGSSGVDSIHDGPKPSLSAGTWPRLNMHGSQPLPVPPIHLQHSVNPSSRVSNQLHNQLAQSHTHHTAALNQQNQMQINSLQPSSAMGPRPIQRLPPLLNLRYPSQGPSTRPSIPIHNRANNSFHLGGSGLPPLPSGPLSQMGAVALDSASVVPNQPPGGAFSGLIGSLMAQGLISLANQPPSQDSLGLEFDADLLKVRHESAISALYGDLPRQCTTCGLRFKCQEEHSGHMDWHVTKNRMSKNRKQKPSRKWFVSSSMWLSGAEALGTEAVPGFLPAETTVEKKDDEELAVPADEDQTACALCGEQFDDFYSDETEEWMYRGAIYMNAPDGSTAGMDRSLLGPIVHAKCRSESSVVTPENFGQSDGGDMEEGIQRKRMRS